MNKLFTLLLVPFLLAGSLYGQGERYLDEVFTDVEVSTEVYGTNATVLFLPVFMEAVPVPLPMDIYSPTGDTETERPMVLVFHTGNFLPYGRNAQIPGTRVDSSVVEICTRLAKRGYVAASCDYRLGWNPLAQTQPERALGLIQAAYRGVQDGRNAVRYVREHASRLGVNPEKITALGQGTGGYLVLGMTGLSSYGEIVETTNGPAKFLLDANADGVPDTPMVIEGFHGDINGEVLTVTPADGSSVAFGLPPGDTTNYVNSPGYSNDFALCVNIGGAIGDISWLADNTTPTISIQSPSDAFAPYNDNTLIVPTTGDPIVQVQGAQAIGAAQEANGANSVFTADNIVFDDATSALARANSEEAGHPYYEGVFPYIQPRNSIGRDEGVAIDWWDPLAPSPFQDTTSGQFIPWSFLPHPSGLGSFHEVGLAGNENMSAQKARGNLDVVMDYIYPRACVALDLPCKSNYVMSSTEELVAEELLSVSPNPAREFITVSTKNGEIIQSVEIQDVSGKSVYLNKNVDSNELRINNNFRSTGLHLINLLIDNKPVTTKVIIK